MSGIVGIVHLDGAPVERDLLQRLTDFQEFRGPDAKQTWLDGPVGFGHTLFRTTEESEHETQPFSLDGKTWIVADARVDAQRELIAELRACAQQVPAGATDAELILRAYLAWDDECVQHLLGDFSFAIWDGPKQRLFCARDHMGVKPFFYAQVGPIFIFSNSLECIRQHPAVSDSLNDLAIADFLLFECNRDPATTSFADIQRLPPAHTAIAASSGFHLRRYWTMPIDEPVFYRHADDYTNRFKELLREALGDRLRTNRIGVFMSGGLDSTTLAATAREHLARRFETFELSAFTVFDSEDPVERDYAQLVAKHLGMHVDFRQAPSESIDPDWDRSGVRSPEPPIGAWNGRGLRTHYSEAASRSRVLLYGEGADNALSLEWQPYIAYLVKNRRFAKLFQALYPTFFLQRRLPFWGRISNSLFDRESETALAPAFPVWLNSDLDRRLGLRARWQEALGPLDSTHPFRPVGYASFQAPVWQVLFSQLDVENMKALCEFRYPFMDLRVLRFLLAVPALPWCRSKYLMRRAMRGSLPNPVLIRPKQGVPGERIMRNLRRLGLNPLVPAFGFDYYVNPLKVSTEVHQDPSRFGEDLRVRSLNLWLQNSWKVTHYSL